MGSPPPFLKMSKRKPKKITPKTFGFGLNSLPLFWTMSKSKQLFFPGRVKTSTVLSKCIFLCDNKIKNVYGQHYDCRHFDCRHFDGIPYVVIAITRDNPLLSSQNLEISWGMAAMQVLQIGEDKVNDLCQRICGVCHYAVSNRIWEITKS